MLITHTHAVGSPILQGSGGLYVLLKELRLKDRLRWGSGIYRVSEGAPQGFELGDELRASGLVVCGAYDVLGPCALQLLGRLQDRKQVCASRQALRGVSNSRWQTLFFCIAT